MPRIAIAALAAWLLAACFTTSLQAADNQVNSPAPFVEGRRCCSRFQAAIFRRKQSQRSNPRPVSRQEKCCAGLLHLRLHRGLN